MKITEICSAEATVEEEDMSSPEWRFISTFALPLPLFVMLADGMRGNPNLNDSQKKLMELIDNTVAQIRMDIAAGKTSGTGDMRGEDGDEPPRRH